MIRTKLQRLMKLRDVEALQYLSNAGYYVQNYWKYRRMLSSPCSFHWMKAKKILGSLTLGTGFWFVSSIDILWFSKNKLLKIVPIVKQESLKLDSLDFCISKSGSSATDNTPIIALCVLWNFSWIILQFLISQFKSHMKTFMRYG